MTRRSAAILGVLALVAWPAAGQVVVTPAPWVDGSGGARGTVTVPTGSSLLIAMAPPSTLAATPSQDGTDLAAGVYTITVTALDHGGGETDDPTAITCTVEAGGAGRCALTWDAVPGAVSYRVWTSLVDVATPTRYFAASTNAYNLDTLTGATVATLPTVGTAYVVSLSSTTVSWLGGRLYLGSGILPTGTNALRIEGTLAASSATAEMGVRTRITSATSATAARRQFGNSFELLSSYTGTAFTTGVRGFNATAGTGVDPFGLDLADNDFNGGNAGAQGISTAPTAGSNYGGHFEANSSTAYNWGSVNVAKTGGTSWNIGVGGFGRNATDASKQIGGLFALAGYEEYTTVVLASLANGPAAAIAANGSQAADIFRGEDNGTPVFVVADGGIVTHGGIAASATTVTSPLPKKITAIADNVATAVFTVTIPNANHAAAIRLMFVSSNGGADAFESSRAASGMVVFARVAGAVAVATAATIDDAAIATVGGGATHTLAYAVSAVSGGATETNTFTITVTIDDSGNLGSNQVMVIAELLNAEATGVTIS